MFTIGLVHKCECTLNSIDYNLLGTDITFILNEKIVNKDYTLQQ